ncbi:MAG TPA: hypothetical protein VGM87_13930 [Roseomonas sp.]|jgi:hypothetical protein
MADAFTPTLNLTKPEINQSINTWGNKLNGDMDLVDAEAAAVRGRLDAVEDRLDAAEPFLVPAGLIAMWKGAENVVPTGWALCDGTNGTPNLRDKFISAAGPTRAAGSSSGANSATANTTAVGAHSHGGGTGATGLTEAQMPSHQHGGATDAQGFHDHALPLSVAAYGLAGGNGGLTALTGLNGSIRTEGSGNHAHGIVTDFRGSGQGHAHSIAADGGHAHSVTVATVPIYFALAFIMKLAAP